LQLEGKKMEDSKVSPPLTDEQISQIVYRAVSDILPTVERHAQHPTAGKKTKFLAYLLEMVCAEAADPADPKI
jgi:hypothetical protein